MLSNFFSVGWVLLLAVYQVHHENRGVCHGMQLISMWLSISVCHTTLFPGGSQCCAEEFLGLGVCGSVLVLGQPTAQFDSPPGKRKKPGLKITLSSGSWQEVLHTESLMHIAHTKSNHFLKCQSAHEEYQIGASSWPLLPNNSGCCH